MTDKKINPGQFPMADYIRMILNDGHSVQIRFNDNSSTNFQAAELHPYDDGQSKVVYVIRNIEDQTFMHAVNTDMVMMITLIDN